MSWKYLLGIGIVVVLVVLAVMPTYAYTLDVVFALTDNYDLVFTPTFHTSQIPRYQLLKPSSTAMLKPYSMLGVDRVYLNVNVTAYNENGTLFFYGQFWFDTLAEHKITMHRQYDPALRTKKIQLQIDARLIVDRTNGTDIDKEYHGTWILELL